MRVRERWEVPRRVALPVLVKACSVHGQADVRSCAAAIPKKEKR